MSIHGSTKLVTGQSQGEVPFNDFVNRMEAMISATVLQLTNTPPSSPSNGDSYMTGSSPTGAWSGQANKIASYYNGWLFFTPLEGFVVFNTDNAGGNEMNLWNGTAWIPLPKRGTPSGDLNQTITGPSQAEVQAISDKIDSILAKARTNNWIAT